MDYNNSSNINPEELNPKIRRLIDYVVSKVNFGMVYEIYKSFYLPDDDDFLSLEELREDLIINLRLALYWGYNMFDDELWIIIIEYDRDELDIADVHIFFRPMLYELHTSKDELQRILKTPDNKIDKLRKELDELVANEDFEQASIVRDVIKELTGDAD